MRQCLAEQKGSTDETDQEWIDDIVDWCKSEIHELNIAAKD